MNNASPTPAGPHDAFLAAAVREAEASGQAPNKIALIKRLREHTGMGLAEAKFTVENYGVRHGIYNMARPAPPVVVVVILAALLALAGVLMAWWLAARPMPGP
jgi:hypothetical protein